VLARASRPCSDLQSGLAEGAAAGIMMCPGAGLGACGGRDSGAIAAAGGSGLRDRASGEPAMKLMTSPASLRRPPGGSAAIEMKQGLRARRAHPAVALAAAAAVVTLALCALGGDVGSRSRASARIDWARGRARSQRSAAP
jgi:hypothetical protein